MAKFEDGPSSYSTLFFIPDYIAKHIDENDAQMHSNPENSILKNFNSHDPETVAFVAMRDTLQISSNQLAQLYNYNKREYETLEAVIDNSNTDYKSLIDSDQVTVLYHFFARVSNKDSWIEICNDLGFSLYFPSVAIDSLYDTIQSIKLRASGKQASALLFFMRLLMFYWDKSDENLHTFWRRSLLKMIHFVCELAVGINVAIFCLLKQKWLSATIIKVNPSEHQIYAQYRDGSNQHQWFSIYSPRLAPIGFKYLYIPNIFKRHNVPSIVAVLDEDLYAMIQCNPPVTRNAKRKVPEIPNQGWFYKCDVGMNNIVQVGPISISTLFVACVERKIDQNTSIYHNKFGSTTLQKLPHVVNAFRKHVQKCKQNIGIAVTAEASIFTATSNNSSVNLNHNMNNHNNVNVFIPETSVYRYQ